MCNSLQGSTCRLQRGDWRKEQSSSLLPGELPSGRTAERCQCFICSLGEMLEEGFYQKGGQPCAHTEASFLGCLHKAFAVCLLSFTVPYVTAKHCSARKREARGLQKDCGLKCISSRVALTFPLALFGGTASG